MLHIESYRRIVGDYPIAEIYKKARKLYGKNILDINSTYMGGGVAEILSSMVPLINNVGIDEDWRILHGNPDFFTITKKFHNALQGGKIHFTEMKKKLYLKTNEEFSAYTRLGQNQVVIIHDPQPLPLITFYKKRQPWIWRCHIDLTSPNKKLWDFLKNFILQYDIVVISLENYRHKDLYVDQRVIPPAIDPLSPKNVELPRVTIEKYLKKFHILLDKPIITQISRFDKWKDPEGVIDVFKKVKEEVDARLILCGSMATDDPEGYKIYERVKRKADKLIEKGDVILITSENNILVNVLQRASSVIIQKSIKEGFGLTVTEALWKERPVVASNIGGITLQIKDGETGFLLKPDDTDNFAKKVIEIIKDKELAIELGRNGKEHVRKNFLITRLIMQHLDLLNEVLS
ncbi:MAG: glycosyl transferase family 1 [Caldiserica bacterium CG02_land_8_20_14_3_00_36_38]|nr:glycosyltransferase [Caldisericota bacterium]OIP14117.1 MAG: glycosyl transferase family 1 [Caldisericum sp. CG2_30_36_11]PIP49742.1 MAG: glycosyl transferase family 1 [Caldiserica bacterium CG23_combo_of_CG06-09_8_20_14_all_35_60]PIV55745.1 MAG: glycosyl transferase family 1 [Caldiserica bacterium CG02_land_8_20_14_3_00_36_38]PIX28683.1 MAG: glycosyl transferase family 1 [Caldiserica bacterium CG_4_8_14_3_um_filter_35_18]